MTPAPETMEQKPENPWQNLIINILIPFGVLYKLGDYTNFSALQVFLVALCFPFFFGLHDLILKKKWNFFSVLGFVSIVLTGGLGLLKLDGFWFAVKEATIPGIIAIATVGSLKTKYPLVRVLLYNEKIIHTAKINSLLAERSNVVAFDRILVQATFLLAGSFVLSAVLNFSLALIMLKSPGGTTEFNKELGVMHLISLVVIVIPCMLIMGLALWKLLSGIKKLTGLDLNDILKTPDKSPPLNSEQSR